MRMIEAIFWGARKNRLQSKKQIVVKGMKKKTTMRTRRR
jgi:hypothetical protein